MSTPCCAYFGRGRLQDGFKGISEFPYEHGQKGGAVFVVASSVGVFSGESYSSLMSFVA